MLLEPLKDYLNNMTARQECDLWEMVETKIAEHVASNTHAVTSGYFTRPHATTFCSFASCRREVAFKALGYPTKPIAWRTRNTFANGHMLEAYLKAVLSCAGLDYDDKTSYPLDGFVTPDGYQVCVTPDAMITQTEAMRDMVADPDLWLCTEIKSISDAGFDKWEREGVQSSKPGYYDQAQLEMYGTGSTMVCFLVINKNTGKLHEQIVHRDNYRIEQLKDLFVDIFANQDPFDLPAPHGLQDVTQRFRGQKTKDEADALALLHNSTAMQWLDVRGRHIGWEVLVDRKLPWQCSYCDFNVQCWEHRGYTLGKGKFEENGTPYTGAYKHVTEDIF